MFNLIPRRREREMVRALTRPEYTPFELLRREFASLFAPFFVPWPLEFTKELQPCGMEVKEKEGEVVVRAEVPGFEAKEVEVSVQGEELTILAEHTEPAKEEKGERRHARLERKVSLPPGVDPAKIEAVYRNGVLEVHLPLPPEAKPRRIEVKA
jgi:HSP20 family molecular chaperone IbpA